MSIQVELDKNTEITTEEIRVVEITKHEITFIRSGGIAQGCQYRLPAKCNKYGHYVLPKILGKDWKIIIESATKALLQIGE